MSTKNVGDELCHLQDQLTDFKEDFVFNGDEKTLFSELFLENSYGFFCQEQIPI